MSTDTSTEQRPTVIGEGLAEEFAELLHLPVEQTRPLPQAKRGLPRRVARHL